ncbi:TPA: hypothetical protein ACTYBL_003546 [Klebsiella aerogenes]
MIGTIGLYSLAPALMIIRQLFYSIAGWLSPLAPYISHDFCTGMEYPYKNDRFDRSI